MSVTNAKSARLSTRLTAQFSMLVVEFLLGMIVNLIGTPGSSAAKLAFRVTLPLHVLLGLGLVVNGILLIRLTAATDDQSKITARAGAALVFAAFVFGGLTISAPLANLWSFGMAAAFIGAFVMYGRLYIRTLHTS
jgi:hypothetical protein